MDTISRRAFAAGTGAAVLLPFVPALAQGLPQRPPGFPPIPDELLAAFRTRLLQTALSMRGQRVGGGQCTHFVTAAMQAAGLPCDEGRLYWGAPWTGGWVPGLVMQMYDGARWEGAGRDFHTDVQHTLILVGSAGGARWNVVHQNWGQERVTVDQLDFGWRLVRGRFALFHPIT